MDNSNNNLKELEKINSIVTVIQSYCKYHSASEEIYHLEPLIEYLSELVNNFYALFLKLL